MSNFEKFGKKIDNLTSSIFSDNVINKISEKRLISNIEKLENATWNINAVAYFTIYFDEAICEEMIDELRIPISKNKFKEIWQKAIIPSGISFEKRRRLYLLDLIKNGKSWDFIAEKCQYFETTYDKVISKSVVKEKLFAEYGRLTSADAKRIIKIELEEIKNLQKKNRVWLKTLNKCERKIVEYIQFVIMLRDARKDFVMKAVLGFYKIGERFFDQVGISHDLIFYVSIDDFKKGIKFLKKNKKNIEKRPDGIVLYVSGDNYQEIEFGNNAVKKNKTIISKFFQKQQSLRSLSFLDSIKGQPGSRGMARGVVKVIKDYQQGKDKLNPGEILVTGMTRPEFVPLMKIARGIITDEGGITCHAAIVSRELGIPCVIGTKIASQVLKDGDLVEMNADKGVIKILKKYKK